MKVVCAVMLTHITLGAIQLQAQTINSVDVRLEGTNVFYRSTPDSVFARVSPGVPFSITWSFEAASVFETIGTPFIVYSPDGSIDNVMWNMPPAPTPFWQNFGFSFGGPFLFLDSLGGGALPAKLHQISTATLGVTYGPLPSRDFLTAVMTVSQEGVLCIDTTFFASDLQWFFTPVFPEWGGEVGGYPDGGFCFEIANCNTCDVAGDLNHDGKTNIADVSYGVQLIFAGGKAVPCPREGDPNGDGMLNIADVIFLLDYNFVGGAPAPVCGPWGMLKNLFLSLRGVRRQPDDVAISQL